MNHSPRVFAALSTMGPSLADLVGQLLPLAPNFGRWTKRNMAAAYEKGIVAGLSFSEPTSPYKPEHSYPNFLHGANYPGLAWKCGVDDAHRARKIAAEPAAGATVYPSLLQSEFRILPEEHRAAIDAGGARDVGQFHTKVAVDR